MLRSSIEYKVIYNSFIIQQKNPQNRGKFNGLRILDRWNYSNCWFSG
jgi:hypothetical protein